MQTKTAITGDDVKLTLAWAAESRRKAQQKVDRLQVRFDRAQTRLSIQAQGEACIPTGKPDEFRLPANEADRKLAAKLICQQDTEYCWLEVRLLAAQRELQWHTDQQANFRVLAELMARGQIERPF
jgi:hypothetical protein